MRHPKMIKKLTNLTSYLCEQLLFSSVRYGLLSQNRLVFNGYRKIYEVLIS